MDCIYIDTPLKPLKLDEQDMKDTDGEVRSGLLA